MNFDRFADQRSETVRPPPQKVGDVLRREHVAQQRVDVVVDTDRQRHRFRKVEYRCAVIFRQRIADIAAAEILRVQPIGMGDSRLGVDGDKIVVVRHGTAALSGACRRG
jgi:hypothetical protein